LPAACRLIHNCFIPFSAASTSELGRKRHHFPCKSKLTFSLSEDGGFRALALLCFRSFGHLDEM
jgi:hypothetical protein